MKCRLWACLFGISAVAIIWLLFFILSKRGVEETANATGQLPEKVQGTSSSDGDHRQHHDDNEDFRGILLYNLPWVHFVNCKCLSDARFFSDESTIVSYKCRGYAPLCLDKDKVRNYQDAIRVAYQEVARSAPELLHALCAYLMEDWRGFGDQFAWSLVVAKCFEVIDLVGWTDKGPGQETRFSKRFWIVRIALPLAKAYRKKGGAGLIRPTLQELWIDAETGEAYPLIPWERWAKADTGKQYPRTVWELKGIAPKKLAPPKLPKTGTRPQPR